MMILMLSASWAVAQTRQGGEVQPSAMHTLSFEARSGEAFSVYVDGELKNRMPQGRVIVTGVSRQSHEVVVVLKRPVDKAAVLQITPHDATVIVNVNYDERLEQLYLYTPSHNRTGQNDDEAARLRVIKQKAVAEQRTLMVATEVADTVAEEGGEAAVDDEVLVSLVQRLKALPFDSDRLALAKVLVSSHGLQAWQIGRLVEAIDISNSQVELLKYAYVYCVDKENYNDAINVLTFSRDRRKVVDYIATQR